MSALANSAQCQYNTITTKLKRMDTGSTVIQLMNIVIGMPFVKLCYGYALRDFIHNHYDYATDTGANIREWNNITVM